MAANRIEIRRKILAGVLLTVFLPAFLFSVLHRHDHHHHDGGCHEEEHICLLCEAGVLHFDKADNFGDLHDACLLCNFLWATFLGAAAAALQFGITRFHKEDLPDVHFLSSENHRYYNLRAPPVCFCI